jgi:hypothetical protein
MSIDPQFQFAQKTRVLMKKSDVWSARRSDVSRDTRRQKRLSVDQRKVVDLTGFDCLVR